MRTKSPFDENCRNIRELVYAAAARCPENNAFKIKVNGEIKSVTFTQVIENKEALGKELEASG